MTMKDLESQSRVIQGGLIPAADSPVVTPIPAPEPSLDAPRDLSLLGSARGAAKAYHTNIRMLGLEELALFGLIPQVADARAQGPSDALVMAVRAIRESGPRGRRAEVPTPPVGTKPGRTSFKKMLSRQVHRSLDPGEVPDGT